MSARFSGLSAPGRFRQATRAGGERQLSGVLMGCVVRAPRQVCSTWDSRYKCMPTNDRTRIIYRRTPESAAMVASVKRAMALTAKLNCLTYDDADEIRELF